MTGDGLQSNVSSLSIVTSKPSPLEMYREHGRTEMVRQRLDEMVWGHRRKILHGWRETSKLHTKREGGENTYQPQDPKQRSGNQ